jgi:hypothetical protein
VRYFQNAVLLTTQSEIAVKLRENRSPIGLDVYDQYMLSLGQRTPAVTKLCSPDLNEDCPLDVSGFQAFRRWLHQRLVIGPNIPDGDRSGVARSLIAECDAEHGVRCGVATLLSVLKMYVRDLAAVGPAFHASRVKSLGDDLGRLKLSATGVNFANGAPSFILDTRVQVASMRSEYPDMVEVECEPPKPNETCYLSADVAVEKWAKGFWDVAASISGLAHGLRIDSSGKERWYAPLASSLDYLGARAYQVDSCVPQIVSNQDQGVPEKEYIQATGSKRWEVYYAKKGKRLPEINTAIAVAAPLRSIVTKGLGALAATATFSNILAGHPMVYARSVVIGVKKTTTGTAAHTDVSMPFCESVF